MGYPDPDVDVTWVDIFELEQHGRHRKCQFKPYLSQRFSGACANDIAH